MVTLKFASDCTLAAEKRPLGGFEFETIERQRKIWLLEGGYCADTKVQDKIDEKIEQHGTL